MNPNTESSLVFRLKNELATNTPDVWEGITKRVTAEIAASLLQELDSPPSPRGRMLQEVALEVKLNVMGKMLGAWAHG